MKKPRDTWSRGVRLLAVRRTQRLPPLQKDALEMSLAPTEGVGKPAPPDEPLAVDTVEASRLLGLSERKTWSLAVSGEIPSFKVGRARRYSVAALRRWIAEREGGAA